MSKNNNADMLCFAKYECPLKGTERDYVKASYIQQSKYNWNELSLKCEPSEKEILIYFWS